MRTVSALLTGVVAASAATAMLLGPSLAGASSHREAPLSSMDPNADLTDVYAFVSPDKPDTVTLIANVIPFESAYGGPNYFRLADDVLYTINVDNNGDAKPDISWQFRSHTKVLNGATFLYNGGPIGSVSDPNWNVQQTYDVSRTDWADDGTSKTTVIGGALPTPPANIGPKSTPNYDMLAGLAVQSTTDGSKVFVGQRDDPFFVDLSALFDLLTIRKLPGNAGGGVDGLAGYNVHTIALQVPITKLTHDGAMPSGASDPRAIIGVWATTARLALRVLPDEAAVGDNVNATTGLQEFHQVGRLGQPLVNEVVVPLAFKDHFNASQPKDDAQFLGGVTDPEVPKLLNLLYGINVPPAPRNDLVQVFLTGVPGLNQPANVTPSEQLRLNMLIPPSASPNRMGVLGGDLQGFPNGRRLADDVTDIALEAMAGVLVNGYNVAPNNQLGDGVDANDQPFMSVFPYVSTPHQGFAVGTEYQKAHSGS
jgi:hypothetical protein